ncbi:hypothetical protein E2C01_075399 [Portunus trituberculatus]|uniref:Uncharacterized protein n=1 Tax=Portunus trituberculatus TaxID=210409 RepID=A0A5B7IFQ9_PORTR|nr:hypothetical protein [Portunus trituberculatus]
MKDDNLSENLRGDKVGTEKWWSLMKVQKGAERVTTIAPLMWGHGQRQGKPIGQALYTGKMCIHRPRENSSNSPRNNKRQIIDSHNQ